MITSLTDERDSALRAADNANQVRGDTEKELEAVRNRLREVSESARSENETLGNQLTTSNGKLADALKAIESLKSELADTAGRLKKSEDALLEEQTKPRTATPAGNTAAP
jgi:chromosome segregation ATPase